MSDIRHEHERSLFHPKDACYDVACNLLLLALERRSSLCRCCSRCCSFRYLVQRHRVGASFELLGEFHQIGGLGDGETKVEGLRERLRREGNGWGESGAGQERGRLLQQAASRRQERRARGRLDLVQRRRCSLSSDSGGRRHTRLFVHGEIITEERGLR